MAINKTTTKDESMSRAVGRRKTAAARARISLGKGNILINDKEYKVYFPLKLYQNKVLAPLQAVGKEKDFDISVRVAGSGISSQNEAVRHAIARALVRWNADFKPVLKAEGYLTRDPREKERKKFGRHRARRGHQWRKR